MCAGRSRPGRPGRHGSRGTVRACSVAGAHALEWLAAAAIVILLASACVWWSRGPAHTPLAARQITVLAGDTLWSLAASHPIQGMTTARVVEATLALNGRERASLTAGETLLLPVATSGSALVAAR